MRLVPINKQTLINPEHVSHITVVEGEAPPTPNGHSYPIYKIVMYDGACYDVPFIHEYPDEHYPWLALEFLLHKLQDEPDENVW